MQQALDDLEFEPFDSTWYNQAVAFLIGGGHWREGRHNIADLLGIDPATFDAFGCRMVKADRARRGLPPIRVTPKLTPQALAQPLPRLEAVKAPPPKSKRELAYEQRLEARKRWHLYNPFDPRWRLNTDAAD